jgi:flagellar motor switch protein FliN/FliY
MNQPFEFEAVPASRNPDLSAAATAAPAAAAGQSARPPAPGAPGAAATKVAASPPTAPAGKGPELPDFDLSQAVVGRAVEVERPANFGSILRIPVTVQVVLGSASMPVASLMKLGRGAVIPLDHRVGEPVDVVVNGRVVARGEVVVVEDDNSRFGVSLTEIVGPNNAETDG